MALKEHRILMVDLLKKEITANGWMTDCRSEKTDEVCKLAVWFNRKRFDTGSLACMASVIKEFSDTQDSRVEIADKLVNKCCRVLLVNDGDGGRWDGR